MCGRFVSITLPDQLAALFGATLPADLPALLPSWNVPPSRAVYAIVNDAEAARRSVTTLTWGFVPHWWSRTLRESSRPTNAMGESVATQPLFRDAFGARRCLIPVDAFYEWQPPDKTPYAFRPAAGGVFAFGAIWDEWTDPDTGDRRRSFAVITTAPNTVVRPVHNRMPLILASDVWAEWLDPATSLHEARALVHPCPADAVTARRVGKAVGNVRNDGPQMLEPAAEALKPKGVDLFVQFA